MTHYNLDGELLEDRGKFLIFLFNCIWRNGIRLIRGEDQVPHTDNAYADVVDMSAVTGWC
jgi:hypothetical protein